MERSRAVGCRVARSASVAVAVTCSNVKSTLDRLAVTTPCKVRDLDLEAVGTKPAPARDAPLSSQEPSGPVPRAVAVRGEMARDVVGVVPISVIRGHRRIDRR